VPVSCLSVHHELICPLVGPAVRTCLQRALGHTMIFPYSSSIGWAGLMSLGASGPNFSPSAARVSPQARAWISVPAIRGYVHVHLVFRLPSRARSIGWVPTERLMSEYLFDISCVRRCRGGGSSTGQYARSLISHLCLPSVSPSGPRG
jgi:hypothetical protein